MLVCCPGFLINLEKNVLGQISYAIVFFVFLLLLFCDGNWVCIADGHKSSKG